MDRSRLIEHGGFRFGSRMALTSRQLDQITPCLQGPEVGFRGPKGPEKVLGGRGAVQIALLDGIGEVVVKHYHRGGILRHAVKHTYLRTGKLRPQAEFEMLAQAADLGLSVPEPIFFAVRGDLFYQAWLATRKIDQALSLAELSLTDLSRAHAAWPHVLEQVDRLVATAIHHVDLHPGNMLIDSQHRVFVLDFDKAYFFRGTAQLLRSKYIERWHRAVLKYSLPATIDL